MADEEASPEGASAPEKKGSSKLIIIIAVVVLLAGGGGGAAWFFLSKPAPEDGKKVEDTKTAEEEAKELAMQTSLGVTHELDPFIVNLSGDLNRYLKAIIVLQLSNEELSTEIDNRKPQIKDSVINVLSSKEPDEILNIQGKYDLKIELIKRINANVSTGVVRDIFFTEFVVQ